MILNLAVFVFLFVPLLSLTASTVVALHSPTRVRGESYNGSSTVLVKWSNQEGVSYYKAALKLPTLQHSIMAHKSAFELTADNLTRIACFKTLGGRCRGKSEVSVLWGPGRIWTYGSEMSLQVGACSTNKSETCLMSSWVKFVVPLGVPDSVELLRAKAVPGLGIDVSWYPPFEPRGPITKYIMSYKTAKDEIKTKQVDGLKTYVVIRNLNPATNYTIWVTAYNARYKGLKSEEVMAMTFEDGCSPSPCAYNSTCRSLDSKLNCECVGAWKGLFL